jgi:uncharacterized phage protein gp47/JayE
MDLSDLVYIDSTGYHFADYPSFLQWRKDQYKSIYGDDVYLEPDSQDGQLLAVQAKSDYDTAALGASVYNSFSPLTAQGVGLSRLVKINGIEREKPSFSTVTLTVIGTAGTIITNGIAADALNQQWLLPGTVTIPFSGTIDVLAVAAVIGFVVAEANTVTTLFTPTLGWQSVNNAAAATPGSPVETDAELRVRQSISTSIPAETVFDSAVGRVGNVSGVSKVKGWENFTGTTDSISLPAHSINITVVGGDSTDIANAIVSGKTPGTNPVGNTGPILVYDSKGMPLNIYFGRAITATIQATIDVTAGVGWSSDYVPLIQQAVADAINALPIGASILYTTLFLPAYLQGTPAYGTFTITDITVGKNGGGQSHTLISLNQGLQGSGAQNPVTDATTDVTVTVT